MTRARWNWIRIRSIVIVGLALWHFFQGTDVGSAKAISLLALAMAWYSLDELDAQRKERAATAEQEADQ